jgi:hypothetical protein
LDYVTKLNFAENQSIREILEGMSEIMVRRGSEELAPLVYRLENTPRHTRALGDGLAFPGLIRLWLIDIPWMLTHGTFQEVYFKLTDPLVD